MSVYGVPRDLPPLSLSFESIILDDPAYTTSSFDAYVDTSWDYATWFVESYAWSIIGDVPVNGDRVLGGIVYSQVASGAVWRVRTKALQARLTELEATIAARDIHMQEETAREKEL